MQDVRDDATWQEIEPNAPGLSGHTYNFSKEDARVYALAVHHLTWLPVLDYSAPWAASVPGDWRSPPADNNQFAAYAAAVASRYGPGGAFWQEYPNLPYLPAKAFEVWNEENGGYFWDTGPDPARYAQLYLATRSAIHAVDPSVQVLIGGIDNSRAAPPARFLASMFSSTPQLVGNVDGVGVHPYQSNPAGVEGVVESVRAELDAVGQAGVPIAITEVGWQTGDSATEAWRASAMSQLASALGNSNCGIDLVAPYDWYNVPGASGGDYGLSDGTSLRPAGTAWFAGFSAAASRSQIALCPGDPVSQSSPTSTQGKPAAVTDRVATKSTKKKHRRHMRTGHHRHHAKRHHAKRHHAKRHHAKRHQANRHRANRHQRGTRRATARKAPKHA